jgi:hypothetical protein
VLAQLIWFLTQCIARGAKQLPITELELVTAAHAVVTVLIYIIWWDKPLDIACYEPVLRSEAAKEKVFGPWDPPSRFEKVAEFLTSDIELKDMPRVPSFFSGSQYIKTSAHEDYWILVQEFAVGTIFGGIHCIAWKFAFLTHAEQMLWRVSAAAITAFTVNAVIAFTTIALDEQFKITSRYPGMVKMIVYPVVGLLYLGVLVYIPARLILIFLSFFTLRDLPPDAFLAVRWTNLIPHIT